LLLIELRNNLDGDVDVWPTVGKFMMNETIGSQVGSAPLAKGRSTTREDNWWSRREMWYC
jgi:hypothetical protein